MIQHLPVRFHIDTIDTLFQRDHDRVNLCVRIAGREVLSLIGVIRIQSGRTLRCNDLGLTDIKGCDIFPLFLAENGGNINVVV